MMNDYKIAGYIVPGALRAANAQHNAPLNTEFMIQLSSTVSSAVAAYGAGNQKAIRKAAEKCCPDFALIAEDFFLALEETPVIAQTANSKEFESIAEFVLEYKDLTPKERIQLYSEQYASNSTKLRKIFRILCLCLLVLGSVICIGMYLFQPEIRKEFLEDCRKLKERVKKIGRYAAKFMKAVKFILHQMTK